MDRTQHIVFSDGSFSVIALDVSVLSVCVEGVGAVGCEVLSFCVVSEFPSSEDMDSSLFCRSVSLPCWEVD